MVSARMLQKFVVLNCSHTQKTNPSYYYFTWSLAWLNGIEFISTPGIQLYCIVLGKQACIRIKLHFILNEHAYRSE